MLRHPGALGKGSPVRSECSGSHAGNQHGFVSARPFDFEGLLPNGRDGDVKHISGCLKPCKCTLRRFAWPVFATNPSLCWGCIDVTPHQAWDF